VPDAQVTVSNDAKGIRRIIHTTDAGVFAAPSLVLQARARGETKAASPDIARFGFTASKALGGAVQRNRARRRLKEAVRIVAPGHAVPGYDYVLIARSGTVQRRFTEITKDLERALTKVHQAPRP